jgi:predicted kinase
VWQKWADNFRETESFVGREISSAEYRRIRNFAEEFFRAHKSLLEARVHEGRVREGHGDLRAEHVCVTDGIVIFDCIEFNEGFRYCDVCSELAFLTMDLDYLGAEALAQQLVETYASVSRDPALSLLLPFYQCYRAYVRGKVECLKSLEGEVLEPERRKAAGEARRHFSLAYRYAQGRPPPALIIVCGLTATGKSTLGQVIRDRTGFALLSSDVTRKRLAGSDPTAKAGARFGEGIYSEDFTDVTYKAMLKIAEERLTNQEGVIIDATFKDAKHRRLFLELAERVGARVIFVECRAEEKEIMRRLQQRTREAGGVSDATQEVYLRLHDEFMPLAEIPLDRHIIARTDFDPNTAINQLDAFLYQAA